MKQDLILDLALQVAEIRADIRAVIQGAFKGTKGPQTPSPRDPGSVTDISCGWMKAFFPSDSILCLGRISLQHPKGSQPVEMLHLQITRVFILQKTVHQDLDGLFFCDRLKIVWGSPNLACLRIAEDHPLLLTRRERTNAAHDTVATCRRLHRRAKHSARDVEAQHGE